MAKVLICNLEVSEFDLQTCYYVNFRINTHEKYMNSHISQAMD